MRVNLVLPVWSQKIAQNVNEVLGTGRPALWFPSHSNISQPLSPDDKDKIFLIHHHQRFMKIYSSIADIQNSDIMKYWGRL